MAGSSMEEVNRALSSRGYGKPGDPLTVAELTHGFAPPDGFTARIEHLSTDPLGIRIEYLAPSRTRAATLVRHFPGDGVMRLSLLDVDDLWRGVGVFSSTINGQTLLRYLKWGLRRLVVEAKDQGRYAWALAGFSFDDPGQAVRAGDAFLDEHLPDGAEAHRAILRKLVEEPWLLARWDDRRQYDWSFTDAAGKPRSGRAHLGKALLLGRHAGRAGMHLELNFLSQGALNALALFRVARRE